MRSPEGEDVDPDAAGARFQPTVFLYDSYPGGIGLSAPLFDLRERVVAGARRMVEDCACTDGCPACIGPILGSDEHREHSPKRLALAVLSLLADADDSIP